MPRLPMLWRRSTMTTTKSSGAGTAARATQPIQYSKTLPRSMSAGNYFVPSLTGTADSELLSRFSEKFLPAETGDVLGDMHELRVLEQFLGRHVKLAGIRDVQCMLLWSEWVRTFRRRTPGFPKLIRENEFRDAVMDTFGVNTAQKGFRGEVYSGIKFSP